MITARDQILEAGAGMTGALNSSDNAILLVIDYLDSNRRG
jgi:hypothetical protein